MNNIPEEDLDKPLGSGERKPLPLLPELEMLEAQITDVKYEFAMFKGQQQYVTDMETKEFILDGNNQKIPRKEFNITFSFKAHQLSNGTPRKTWLKLGASLGEKAKLTKFLRMINVNLVNPTTRMLITVLLGKNVKFQLVNKADGTGKIWQNINFDSIRSLDEVKTNVITEPADIDWEP